jgi:PUA-domain protein
MPKIERIKKRHLLKKRDQKEYMDRIENELGAHPTRLDSKVKLEEGILDTGERIILYEGEIIFFEDDGKLLPTLHALLRGVISIPTVTVDMGAVRFVINGADIMRPGITKIAEGIASGSVVAIVDERHGKPLAVGVSKMSTEELRAAAEGKVIMSKHHVNDALWNFGKG